jgi:imidazolonepropionase-like amidohydrolase
MSIWFLISLLQLAGANVATLLLESVVAADTLAIERATVLPMNRDTALTDHTILVAGDRIFWVGPSATARIPRSARRIDAHNAFVMPGLADMHVHIERRADLARFVAAGVTTVRNMRGGPQHVAWRDSIARGQLSGPTIITSGPTCCHGILPKREFIRIRTPADADAAIAEQKRIGYDMVKVHSNIPPKLFERLAVAAHDARLPVVGHVVKEVGLERQLSAGQASFEHYNDVLDESRPDADARAIALSGAWVGTIASSRDGSCQRPSAGQQRILAALRRNSVKLLAGTDASLDPLVAGTALHCELQTLVGAGLTPFEALASATRNPGEFARARLPNLQPFGTVTVGSRADLLLLSADPRVNLDALARPIAIMLRGTLQDRSTSGPR